MAPELALVPQHQPSEILSPEEGPPAAAMPLAERVAWLLTPDASGVNPAQRLALGWRDLGAPVVAPPCTPAVRMSPSLLERDKSPETPLKKLEVVVTGAPNASYARGTTVNPLKNASCSSSRAAPQL